MKEKLIEYLKEKYNPVAIVLHGSRANGNAREHSDWDFIIFTREKVNAYRDIQFGANFEIKEVALPVNDVWSTLGFIFRKENTEILYDPENIVPELLDRNMKFFKQGNTFEEKDRLARYAFLRWAIDTIGDYRDNDLIIFKKKSDFYDRAVPAWFRFKHKEFRPSDYVALPRIKKDDPEFYELLEVFVNGNVDDSIKSGERMIKLLFPDLAS